MFQEGDDPREARILLDALVSYGDSCTLPDLTPSCPYYENLDGVPSCDEQCRVLLARWGGNPRPIESHSQGGLVLTGRAIPRVAASGHNPFDAGERYLRDRGLPLAEQSTGSLLLGLESAMTAMPHPERLESIAQALDVWDELERRGLPVEAVVRAGILPTLATHIAALITIPYVNLHGDLFEASDEMLERLNSLIEPWQQVLEAAVASEGTDDQVRRAIRATARPAELHRRLFGVQQEFEIPAAEFEVPGGRDLLLISYALSGRFIDRVTGWLSRTLAEDKLPVLAWQAPPPGIFCALRVSRQVEEHGLWLWERNTLTDLNDWTTSSLAAEWRAHEMADHNLSPLVYGERSCDHERVANTVLTRMSSAGHNTPRPVTRLHASELTTRAVELLQAGDYEAASDLFAGLVELRPWDGEALNNLGFCLVPTDPESALLRLQEASLYPHDNVPLNVANRVFVLALLGRRDDALALAEAGVSMPVRTQSPVRPCFVWRVKEGDDSLNLEHAESQYEYLDELLERLSSQ